MDTREIINQLDNPLYEAEHKELHRVGKTRYEPLPNYNEKICSRSYNIDESSDDESMAESGHRPLSPTNFTPINYIRVQSKEVKNYHDLEEGLHGEGKRLAKKIKTDSNGKCIRRIYDLDEPSSDEEHPKVKKSRSDGEKNGEKQPVVNLEQPYQYQYDDFPLDETCMVLSSKWKGFKTNI